MSNDSAHGPAVGTHPGSFSEGEYWRWTSWTQADPDPTCVFEAVLWILNTGAQWHMLPQSYPNYKSVHRRFQTWCRDEVLRRVLTDVANELRDRGALDEEESSSTQPSLWPRVAARRSDRRMLAAARESRSCSSASVLLPTPCG